MYDQKVLEDQYITSETLYKTYIRETNNVVKFPTRQLLPRKRRINCQDQVGCFVVQALSSPSPK
jgi:glutathione peroxidase-family protein